MALILVEAVEDENFAEQTPSLNSSLYSHPSPLPLTLLKSSWTLGVLNSMPFTSNLRVCARFCHLPQKQCFRFCQCRYSDQARHQLAPRHWDTVFDIFQLRFDWFWCLIRKKERKCATKLMQKKPGLLLSIFKKCWERVVYLHGKYNSLNLICKLNVRKNSQRKDSLCGCSENLRNVNFKRSICLDGGVNIFFCGRGIYFSGRGTKFVRKV